MKKIIEFLNKQPKELIVKNITVYGWQNTYEHLIISSVLPFLFEDLNITENVVPINPINRPGRITKKQYITIHDTGDASPLHTALFWSNAVYNQSWEDTPGHISPYACSYQYVVDNEGIYHNVPDNEVAYHAGDGTKFDYTLYPTNILSSDETTITIEDGYYYINGENTTILAPRIYFEKDNKVLVDRLPKTSDLNDQSILYKVIDGKYYIGETYYSSGYKLIANRGGNNNSIGIESCITKNTDLYYTWQKTAKLTAKLLNENDLTIDDVKQHHYFSGKNCPQTIRMNDMWNHFLELVKWEKSFLDFQKEGYSFKLETLDKRVLPNGRIISLGDNSSILYTIVVKKDENVLKIPLEITIPLGVELK